MSTVSLSPQPCRTEHTTTKVAELPLPAGLFTPDAFDFKQHHAARFAHGH